MIGDIISALIGNYMTTFFVVGLLVGVIQVAVQRSRHTYEAASGTMLNAYLLYAIGCASALNFVMHSVFGDYAAKTIGWAQSPFQLELAFSSLGVAVMAFILHGRATQFRAKLALAIANGIFVYGAAGGHIYQMIANHDFAADNTGLLLAMDILIPTVGIAFAIWHGIALHRGTSAQDVTDVPEPVRA